jgi:hypothetical protein
MRRFLVLASIAALAIALLQIEVAGGHDQSRASAGAQAEQSAKRCAKQRRALRKARTKAAKRRARRALRRCLKKKKQGTPAPPGSPGSPGSSAVSVAPPEPYVDEELTVKIKGSLGAGNVYRLVVKALGGSQGDGDSHEVTKDTNANAVLVVAAEDPDGGDQWAVGKGSVSVTEVPENAPEGTAGKSIGTLEFRFIQR